MRAEDDGYVLGQGRKRTKFSRESGGWRYEERSPSPKKLTRSEDDEYEQDNTPLLGVQVSAKTANGRDEKTHAVDDSTVTREDITEPAVDRPGQGERPVPNAGPTEFVVPPLPPSRVSQPSTSSLITSAGHLDEHTATTTPYLMPLASPGLPLVSPLMKDPGSFSGYFLPPSEPSTEHEVGAQITAETTLMTDDNISLASPFFQDFTQERSATPPSESFTGHQRLVDTNFQLKEPPLKPSNEGPTSTDVIYPSLDQVLVDDPTSKPSEEVVAPVESDDELEIVSVRENIQSISPAPFRGAEDDQALTLNLNVHASDQATLQKDELDMYGVSDDEAQISSTGPAKIPKNYDSTQAVQEDSTKEQLRDLQTLESNEPDMVIVDRELVMKNIPSNETVTERQSQDWKVKLELSATESFLENMPISPPPFPFVQKWDHNVNKEVSRRRSSGSRRSSYRGSMDGSDDRMDSDEDQYATAIETGHHPTYLPTAIAGHHRPEGLQSANSPSSTTQSDEYASESDSEDVQIIPGPEEHRLEDKEDNEEQRRLTDMRTANVAPQGVEGSLVPLRDLDDKTSPDDDEKLHETQKPHLDPEPAHLSPQNGEVLSGTQDTIMRPMEEVTESIEETSIQQASWSHSEDEVSRPRQQLVTPSTSQPRGQHEIPMEVSTEIMKPDVLTPQATQSFNDVPSLVPASTELDATFDDKLDRTVRRRSPRLTRRVQRASMVSPWFTPAKSDEVPPASPGEKPRSSLRERSPPQTRRRFKGDTEELIPVEDQLTTTTDAKDVDRAIPDDSIRDQSQSQSTYSEWPKGLRTPLAYFPSLSGLTSYFNQTVDIIGLCTSASTNAKRAPSGPKDYFTTLHVSDPLISGLPTHEYDLRAPPVIQTTSVQIFRPWRNALPSTKEGDVVLLRHFKVQSRKRAMMLLSTEGSGWVVFPSDVAEEKVSGPPVEYGELETENARKLQTWWHDTQNIRKPREQPKAGVKDDPAVANDEKPLRKGHKRESSKISTVSAEGQDIEETITVQKNPDGAMKAEDAAAQQSVVQHELRDGRIYVDTDGNAGHHRRTRSQKALEEQEVHELRDGVRWRDV